MFRVVISLTALVLCLALAASAGASRMTSSDGRAHAAVPVAEGSVAPSGSTSGAGGAAFAHEDAQTLRLLADLRPGGDAVYSPLSIATALAMVDQGASGVTAAQLDRWLGVPDPAAAASASAALGRAMHRAVTAHGSGGPTLDSANSLWVQAGLSLDRPFASALADSFDAAPRLTDFANPAGAIAAINGWASTRTHGLIPSLMGPGQISSATRLVLANAIYLNARWRSPFDPNRTTPGPFHTGTSTVSVPFMDSGELSSYPTARGTDWQAVALPYAHSSLQFLAVMPTQGQLTSFEKGLDAARLSGIAAGLHTHALELFMPKFTLSLHTSLNPLLQREGITRAFGASSQLDRIVRGQNLLIQAVEHAAVLKVAEKGTVAAAATGISAAPTAVQAQSTPLRLDHPFLVFLRDATSGAILFAARVENPAGAA